MSVSKSLFFWPVSRPIGEPLPADLFQGCVSALRIRSLAVCKAEVKLSAVALQVHFADVVIRPVEAAFEQAKEAFHGVCVNVTACVFANRMIDAIVQRKFLFDAAVMARGICEKLRLVADLFHQDRLERGRVYVGNVIRARSARSINQRENFVFVHGFEADLGRLASGNAAVKGFIRLNDPAVATHQAATRVEGLTDAMSHKPRGLVGNSERAVELVTAHAFLGRAEEIDRLQPDVERDLAALKHGAHGYRKLLAAVLALPQARTVRLTLQRVVIFAHRAAMRAHRAIGPTQGFKVFPSLFSTLEVRLVNVIGGHGCVP
jgi:hypothetical protein